MRKRGTRWWFRQAMTALALFSLSSGYAQSGGDGALNGQSGLVARPLYGAGEDLPKRVMGIGVSDQGDVYVTETVRQAREEISLLQSSYLHEVDMGLKTVEQKRDWIERNYSPRIAASQRMEDQDADGDVDLRDLVVRSERIHVLEDADGDGRFDRSRLFAEGFNDILTGVAHSVNPIGDAVYATIIPDLWKLEDTDGDGRADKRESVVHGFANHIGYGNHDLHSVIQGFDGKLYWSMGDRGLSVSAFGSDSSREMLATESYQLFEQYCFDCHDDLEKKGDLDLVAKLEGADFDGALVFENLINGKMPPAEKRQPSMEERSTLLKWLASQQKDSVAPPFRRISRHEFVHSVNDLLGTRLDLVDEIPEDRGTNDFDTNRRISLSQEMLSAYFETADKMLDFAFPKEGFPQEKLWTTNTVKDSHETYNIYLRPYEEGMLFSWTRANNGNNYSFFYDNFEPPVAGWYDLTFEAKKLGDFDEDISLQVYTGKYYYADDRPQPQRLIGVISLANPELDTYQIRAFLNPGENVSVHSYSKHTFRKKETNQGAYIKRMSAQGPVYDSWPPESYRKAFSDLSIEAPPRELVHASKFQTTLQKIGGKLTVSSFQLGKEKDKMQDGSHLTYWQSQFAPNAAKSPHYVILENPHGAKINGLSYATWSGGDGDGQVTRYVIHLSDDGINWGDPIAAGELETRLANEQPIVFREATTKRYIKFLVTDSLSVDGQSLASIGKLDVIASLERDLGKSKILVASRSSKDLKPVLRRFAEKAFSSILSDKELAPYLQVSQRKLKENGDFVQAARAGFKAIICSPRFLMAPGEYSSESHAAAASLARTLWLSVPDDELQTTLSEREGINRESLQAQIDRMLRDERSQRMIQSFSDQWLNLRSLNKVTPSLKLYPEYNDLLDHYLPIETRAYLNHLIQENLPVSRLIDSDFSFLNQRLAQHYGIDGVYGQELRKISFLPDMPRGGLLTMGSVLKVTTDGYDTSPILRGAWISKNIVGTPISPPPEDVPVIEPNHAEATTLKEQIEMHKSSKTCYACHKSIDPYGYALESFDATGQWRTRYRVEKPHKRTFTYRIGGFYSEAGQVDASGEIDDTEFDDIFGLKNFLLSDHRKIAYNFAKKFFEYSNGYQPSLRQRLDLFEQIPTNAQDCGMKDLVADVLIYSLTQEAK